MTVSEYIVKYLKACGVTHYFGYQGTMIAYFVDAIYRETGVYNHVSYNEQGAALAASGFTKATGNMAVVQEQSICYRELQMPIMIQRRYYLLRVR